MVCQRCGIEAHQGLLSTNTWLLETGGIGPLNPSAFSLPLPEPRIIKMGQRLLLSQEFLMKENFKTKT